MFSASARSRYNCAIASTSCSSEVTRTAYSYTSWPRCNSAMPVSTRCPVVGSCSSTASASRTFRRRITTRRGRLQPLNCNWLLKPSQPAPAATQSCRTQSFSMCRFTFEVFFSLNKYGKLRRSASCIIRSVPQLISPRNRCGHCSRGHASSQAQSPGCAYWEAVCDSRPAPPPPTPSEWPRQNNSGTHARVDQACRDCTPARPSPDAHTAASPSRPYPESTAHLITADKWPPTVGASIPYTLLPPHVETRAGWHLRCVPAACPATAAARCHCVPC